MANNITIDLKARKDKSGKTFFVGKIESPVLIDCSKGAVFLIFTSENGQEEMQIACMSQKENFED